ncbi:hypothetical protein M8C21_024909, partial [Ambrosia artemisiifolia]
TTSKRLSDRKVERFQKNIKKRGSVPETTTKKKDSYPVGPIVLGPVSDNSHSNKRGDGLELNHNQPGFFICLVRG